MKKLGIFNKKDKLQAELDMTGVLIDEVYGSKRTNFLFICLSKAIIIFLVCYGTISGFSDAFSLEYNKTIVAFFVMLISVMISLLYWKKKIFYIGYIILLLVFTIELIRYYLYANSGFQAIMNTVREAYADHFDMNVVRTSEESYTNRYVTITVALVFISIFLVIMFNVTVSRYMNFIETFLISFIILEIPLYIGLKPSAFSVVIVMSGCICTAVLQRGGFNRITIPGKKSPDFIQDKLFKKNYFTTRGNHHGILIALAFSFVFSVILYVFSIGVYERPMGETVENSAKSAADDNIKIFIQNGILGFFNRYDSLNGLNRGALGGVSSVRPDFQTDLIVSYVPDKATVYLPGFRGVVYDRMNWTSYYMPEAFGLEWEDDQNVDKVNGNTIVSDEIINLMEENFTKSVLAGSRENAKMQISYVDRSFGMDVAPYITYQEDIHDAGNTSIAGENENINYNILMTKDIDYLPIDLAKYGEESGTDERYEDYVNVVCRYVPTELNKFLKDFIRENENLGLGVSVYKTKKKDLSPEEMNEARLQAAKAVELMFLNKYPYSLSPGKTPDNEDFVRYFLETQKRGFCSHFASAAVMILRHLGIPARYTEGYVIPYSSLGEECIDLDLDGNEWYSGENEFNPYKNVKMVEVSDYYAHAWVEIYLEGKGFVPYEVTPPSFEAVPVGAGLTGIGAFFSRLMNVDLGIGDASEGSVSINGNLTQNQSIMENVDTDLTLLLKPLAMVITLAFVFWLIFLLVRFIAREIRYKGYYKEGNFRPLIYARYNELVKKLMRKRIVTVVNPLPMELSGYISEYILNRKKQNENENVTNEKSEEIGEKYIEIFRYTEKVLYSDYVSSAKEYDEFYEQIKNMRF